MDQIARRMRILRKLKGNGKQKTWKVEGNAAELQWEIVSFLSWKKDLGQNLEIERKKEGGKKNE